jgi:hypothetical protein
LSEPADREQITRIRPLHRVNQSKQNRNFHQTLVRLTTRRFDDIAPDREKGCLNFLYVLVARIELDRPEMGGVRDRGIDYRAVIAKAAIEVMIELP